MASWGLRHGQDVLPEPLVHKLASAAEGGWRGRIARDAGALVHRCGGLVLVGLDDEAMAWPAYADPIPLTVAGEAAALMAGRKTYTLRGIYVFTLTYRDRWVIEAGRRDDIRVLASHECAIPIPAEWRM